MSQDFSHDTISISRRIKAPREWVFSAWEDPQARSIWGPPSEDESIEFLENDFREGGLDVHLCGQKSDLRFRVETHYYEIRRPQRLLFTERVTMDSSSLSVSLVSVEIRKIGSVTELEVTIQIASLAGLGMIDGTRNGWQRALSNLTAYLEARKVEAE
ncbi:SRPBCC domain-containing protein [Microbulbifer sp. ZKSA004]|uniref:SRPBCC domain-containing protein n=1 Tax=Microbulbifer sp. ZKSA004 TaxID=3243389 RepID=UPI0040391FEA